METYKMKVYCGNCDFRGEIDIPKGVLVSEAECTQCGTTTLAKDINVDLGGGYSSFM